eukprot:TRINITY_DN11298_c0_g2_i1.p1 TRINITY_DN11298_c0_g2~~TRINITY_DN11298_c0_g2_i1.p1  ORF type:complete len:642 (-),score=96.40 TRINITY_DN11298_c0_g2_i1:26-1951(-)
MPLRNGVMGGYHAKDASAPCLPAAQSAPLPSVASSTSTSSEDTSRPRDSYVDAPPGHGVLITLDADDRCWIRIVEDTALPHIHPHVRVPAALQDPVQLGGGGSGVTIIRGLHPDAGDVVIKHGGHRETREVFALASISHQLRLRGQRKEAADASAEIEAQRPELAFVYISQEHLWNRSAELWSLLRTSIGNPGNKFAKLVRHKVSVGKRSAGIRICTPAYRESSSGDRVEFNHGRLHVFLDSGSVLESNDQFSCCAPGKGYMFLNECVQKLVGMQMTYNWKFTLAQRTIGGSAPVTASTVLTEGKLHGRNLDTLLHGMLRVIHNLRALTSSEEAAKASDVRREVASCVSTALAPSQISSSADAYVGFAIKKNFHETTGRFKFLIDLGESFRAGSFRLTAEEGLPGEILGRLLWRGTVMQEVFEFDGEAKPNGLTALDVYVDPNAWRRVLELVLSINDNASVACLWSSGITDGGIHNLFLDTERIWLFDLGEPALTALPAFLTKFLMSFFHVLGMQAAPAGDSDGAAGVETWVVRFEEANGKRLRATPETQKLLQLAREAFREALSRLVSEVFAGEQAVRGLLVEYVVLQLLSDAAFCLQRWRKKGGGARPVESLHPQPLEKWLWRAIWDVYVATDVSSRQW